MTFTDKDYNSIAICPLIGGMAIASEQVIGKPPIAVVSETDAFEANDSQYIRYLDQRGIHLAYRDYRDNGTEEFITQNKVDLATVVPPCAGLSIARKGAGAHCESNKWMSAFSEFAMRTGVRCIVGENSPNLVGKMGEPIRKHMEELANHYGYSASYLKTSTHLHGIPQKRVRSFFVFLENQKALAPFAQNLSNLYGGSYLNYLNTFPSPTPEELNTSKSFEDDAFVQFVRYKGLFDEAEKSLLMYIKDKGLLSEFAEWTRANGYKDFYPRIAERLMQKAVWDSSPKLRDGSGVFPTIMFRSMGEAIMSRGELRTPTVRECMRLMGLPEDMEEPWVLDKKGNPVAVPNMVAQNVPVCTAKWAIEVGLKSLEESEPGSQTEPVIFNNFKASGVKGL